MKKTILFILAASFSVSVFAQWVEQATGFSTPSRGINQIVITDENPAWPTAYDGSGAAAIIQDYTRTIDGGTTWQAGSVTAAPSGYDWSCIAAVDGSTASALFWDSDL